MKTKLISMLLLLSIILSCRKDQQTVAPKISSINTDSLQSLSLSQVKDWYGVHSTSSVNLQTEGTLKFFSLSSLQLPWDKIQSVKTKTGNYWLAYLNGQPTFQNVKQGYRKIAFMKDSVGNIQARILEIIPDVLYIQQKQKATTADFTGRIFIYNQSYHLLGGKVFSNGKQIGKIKPKASAATNSTQLRTNELQVIENCNWYDSNYVDSEGVFTVYSEQICDYTIYDDGFYPDMGGSGGGSSGDPIGGGGGGGGDASSSPAVSNLPGETLPSINPRDYIRCFGSVPDAGATMSVTLYVQEPFPGTTFNAGPNSVGHVALGLTKTNGSNTITQVVGYYPDATGLAKMHAPSKLSDNSGTAYNVSITYNVSATQFQAITDYVNTPPPTYDLINNNCTNFAYYAVANAGILPPPSTTTVGLVGPGGATVAMTPAGMGDGIQSMSGQPNVNTNGGTMPQSHGPCN